LRKILTSVKMLIIVFLFTLPGCGSGGGGGGTSSASPQAVVTLSTQTAVPLASNSIRGIELYLVLPAGVSVKTDATGKTNSGVIAVTGSAAGPNVAISGNYPVTDPVSGAVNTLKIEIVNVDGFNPGDFATVTCDRATGVSPSAAAFQTSGFKPVDQTGTVISDLSITFSMLLK
jgi:hypothetical protein